MLLFTENFPVDVEKHILQQMFCWGISKVKLEVMCIYHN